jgi:hypothetical protein
VIERRHSCAIINKEVLNHEVSNRTVFNKTTMLLETQRRTLLAPGSLWDGSKVELNLRKEEQGGGVDHLWN